MMNMLFRNSNDYIIFFISIIVYNVLNIERGRRMLKHMFI